jgi:hypothetical protein
MGPIVSTGRFIINKFRSIKSGNSLFEMIVFLCSYGDVIAGSYLIDHIAHSLPISVLVGWWILASAFIKVMLMLLFDERGLSGDHSGSVPTEQ